MSPLSSLSLSPPLFLSFLLLRKFTLHCEQNRNYLCGKSATFHSFAVDALKCTERRFFLFQAITYEAKKHPTSLFGTRSPEARRRLPRAEAPGEEKKTALIKLHPLEEIKGLFYAKLHESFFLLWLLFFYFKLFSKAISDVIGCQARNIP